VGTFKAMQILHNRLVISFCVYLFYVSALTLSPFQFSWDSEWSFSLFSSVSLQDIEVDIILNLMGFAPFGFIMYLLPSGENSVQKRLCLAICCALLVSFAFEFLQTLSNTH